MKRAYYADTIVTFLGKPPEEILGELAKNHAFTLEPSQRDAWLEQIAILRSALKPYAIDVRSPIDPVHWFLDGKEDVRSSYYLEDVATEFDVQGLELDWTCVTWDADFRYSEKDWENWSFCGDRWNHIRKSERQMYLKNAYRVLLTRARQGMVIVVPPGSDEDPTRKSEYYDSTYQYLRGIGFSEI